MFSIGSTVSNGRDVNAEIKKLTISNNYRSVTDRDNNEEGLPAVYVTFVLAT